MRRLLLLAVLIAAVLTVPALAQDETIALTFPSAVYDVSGTVSVRGTVNVANLQAYYLEVATYDQSVPDTQARWTPISLPSKKLVSNDVLANWQTTQISDGIYRLRLHVVLQGGESRFVVVGPVRVGNQLPRPEGQPVAVVPTAVPTLAAPTAAPTEPPAPQFSPTQSCIRSRKICCRSQWADRSPTSTTTASSSSATPDSSGSSGRFHSTSAMTRWSTSPATALTTRTRMALRCC